MSNTASHYLRGIPADLWNRAKLRADLEGRSLKSLFLEWLKSYADDEAIEDAYLMRLRDIALAEPGEDIPLADVARKHGLTVPRKRQRS